MRKPNHIVLDFESNNLLNSNFYWATNVLTGKETPLFLRNVPVYRKYSNSNYSDNTTDFINSLHNNTLKPNSFHKANFLKDWEKRGLINIYKLNQKPLDLISRQSKEQDMFNYLNFTPYEYKKQHLIGFISKYKTHSSSTLYNSKLQTLVNTVNINFLRKERLYTKLKYSRSPAYDTVSGGAAALLAGFLGFLISEKFGYELVDSGDFYYAFMYIVFLVFSLKPLLTVSDSQKGFLNAISLKPAILFYSSIVKLLLKKF